MQKVKKKKNVKKYRASLSSELSRICNETAELGREPTRENEKRDSTKATDDSKDLDFDGISQQYPVICEFRFIAFARQTRLKTTGYKFSFYADNELGQTLFGIKMKNDNSKQRIVSTVLFASLVLEIFSFLFFLSKSSENTSNNSIAQ